MKNPISGLIEKNDPQHALIPDVGTYTSVTQLNGNCLPSIYDARLNGLRRSIFCLMIMCCTLVYVRCRMRTKNSESHQGFAIPFCHAAQIDMWPSYWHSRVLTFDTRTITLLQAHFPFAYKTIILFGPFVARPTYSLLLQVC